MKTTMIILLVITAIILSACGANDATPSAPAPKTTPSPSAAAPSSEQQQAAPLDCSQLAELNATVTTKKQTLESEQRELLKEKDALQQRLQKFKVLKLNYEVKQIEKQLANLTARC